MGTRDASCRPHWAWIFVTFFFIWGILSLFLSPFAEKEDDSPTRGIMQEKRLELLKRVYEEKEPHFMECPAINTRRIHERYGYLRSRPMNILFGGNTHNTEAALPTQIRAITELIRYLPQSSFGFSIHESGSKDKTGRILTEAFIPLLHSIGIEPSEIFITSSKEGPNWSADPDQRIPILVDLRNLVISHLWKKSKDYDILLFFNDIFFCVDDLLELIHQHVSQSADITCAFDWHPYYDTKFYDTWVARDIAGKMIWETDVDHFQNHAPSRRRYEQRLPIQVYSCWNGMLIFSAPPLVDQVKFRNPNETKGECRESEASRICKDYWLVGKGKIQMIPSIGVGYSEDKYIKGRNEWQTPTLKVEDKEVIDWVEPPEKVRCIAKHGNDYGWGDQVYLPDHL